MKLKNIPPAKELYKQVTTLPNVHAKNNYKTYRTLGDAYLKAAILVTLTNQLITYTGDDVQGMLSNRHLARVYHAVKPTIHTNKQSYIGRLDEHDKGDIIEAMLVYYYHYDMVGFHSLINTIVFMYFNK